MYIYIYIYIYMSIYIRIYLHKNIYIEVLPHDWLETVPVWAGAGRDITRISRCDTDITRIYHISMPIHTSMP